MFNLYLLYTLFILESLLEAFRLLFASEDHKHDTLCSTLGTLFITLVILSQTVLTEILKGQ